MANEKTNAQANRAHVGHFTNPDHPSWKLPVGKAYEATPEELKAIRQKLNLNRASAEVGSRSNDAVEALGTDSTGGAGSGPNVLQVLSPEKTASLPSRVQPTLAEQKAEAADCMRMAYAMHGSGFRIRSQPMAAWHAEAKRETEKDGCDLPTALLRVGFVHALVSVPPVAPPKVAPAAVPPAPASASARTGHIEPRYTDSPPFSNQEKESAAKAFSAALARDECFRVQMNTAETWNKLAEYRASSDGCDFATALQRVGFVHPAISVTPTPR